MRYLPFAVGFAFGAAVVLVERSNIGLFVGIITFWTITAIVNKTMRGDS